MKKIKYYYLIIFLLGFSISNLFADDVQNITNQQDIIIRNQQNISDFESREKEQAIDLKKLPLDEEKKIDLYDFNSERSIKNCQIIKLVKFNDTEVLSDFAKENLKSEIINQCFSSKKISNLIEKITDLYDQQGYLTTEIEISTSKLDQGIIEIKIFEKKIEKIIFEDKKNNSGLKSKINKITILNGLDHELLNINDLNQLLFQLNRLQSNKASYIIQNGSNRNFNNVIIKNNKSKIPLKISAGHDNLGNKSTGLRRSILTGSFDNLLSFNENINLSINTNLNDNPRDRDIKTYSSNIHIPFGYYTLAMEYLQSDFYGKDINNRNFSGFSNRKNITINKLFIDSKDYRISGKIAFTTKETASYQENIKILNSQRKLNIIHSSIPMTYFLDSNTTIFFKPSIFRGIKQFNANRDYSFVNPQLNFTIFKFYTSFQKKLTFFNLNQPIIYLGEIDSQIANKRLFGSEQFSIGGYTSVRGFRERNIGGEKGFYWRNRIDFNLGSIFKSSSINNYLNKTRFQPFIDFGYIKRIENNKSSNISGTGFTTIFSNKHITSSITFSWATKQSSLANSKIKENKLIYFEISTSCCNF